MNTATKWAVVDDDDPSIQYSAGWGQEQGNPEEFHTNSGKPYLQTLHGISQNGSLSFQYHGSNIYVWGLDPGNLSERPSWECLVDDFPIRVADSTPVPQNNWPLCWDDGLLNSAMGPHTLTINVVTNPSDARFRIDWIQYNPQPGFVFDTSSSQRNAAMLVDNTDPIVQYDDSWSPWTNLSQTANATSRIGSQVTVDFIGTSLSWFGISEPGNFSNTAQGSYSIDGADDVVFSWKTDPGTALDRRFFFEASNLPLAPHRAVVKYLGPASAPSLILDHLIIQNASTTQITLSGSAPRPTGGAPPDDQNKGGSGVPAGVIAGSVVGGLAFVIVILLLWFKRRLAAARKQQRHDHVHPFRLIGYTDHNVPRPTSFVSSKTRSSNSHNQTASSHSHNRSASDPFSQTSELAPIRNPAQMMPAGPTVIANISELLHPTPFQLPATHPNHSYPPDQPISSIPEEYLPLYTEINDR